MNIFSEPTRNCLGDMYLIDPTRISLEVNVFKIMTPAAHPRGDNIIKSAFVIIDVIKELETLTTRSSTLFVSVLRLTKRREYSAEGTF